MHPGGSTFQGHVQAPSASAPTAPIRAREGGAVLISRRAPQWAHVSSRRSLPAAREFFGKLPGLPHMEPSASAKTAARFRIDLNSKSEPSRGVQVAKLPPDQIALLLHLCNSRPAHGVNS